MSSLLYRFHAQLQSVLYQQGIDLSAPQTLVSEFTKDAALTTLSPEFIFADVMCLLSVVRATKRSRVEVVFAERAI